jgi:hypothetical protein
MGWAWFHTPPFVDVGQTRGPFTSRGHDRKISAATPISRGADSRRSSGLSTIPPMRRSIVIVGGVAALFSAGVLVGRVAKPSAAPAASLTPAPVSKVDGVKVPSLPKPVAAVSLRPAPTQPSESQTTGEISTSITTTPSVEVGSTSSGTTTPAKTSGKGSRDAGEAISSGSGG